MLLLVGGMVAHAAGWRAFPQETGARDLCNAIRHVDRDRIETLMLSGTDANIDCGDGVTALHDASRLGLEDVVERLVKVGAQVDIRDAWGRTALMKAVEAGHDAIVRTLIAGGADVNLRDQSSVSALGFAAAKGYGVYAELMDLLLDEGADVRDLARFGVSLRSSRETRLSAQLVADPEHLKAFRDDKAFDDLMEAFLAGDVGTARRVLVSTGDQKTLRDAARRGDLEVVKFLLDAEVDPNAALPDAAAFGHRVMCELALARGADPDGVGGAPLVSAVAAGRIDIVRVLLMRGAHVNLTATREYECGVGETFPLGMARARDEREIEALLIEYGASSAQR